MVLALTSQAPLTPSADEAQQWARTELAKAIYNNDPTLLEQVINWLKDLWQRLQDATGALGPVATPLIVVGILVLILLVGFLIAGPVRRRRRGRASGSATVLDGDERTADELRTAAESAAAAGNYSLAVLERFRAVVRALDERAVLTDRAGRTAHEAAAAAARAFGDHAEALTASAQLFDAVCYGQHTATSQDYQRICEMDRGVAAQKPAGRGRDTELQPAP